MRFSAMAFITYHNCGVRVISCLLILILCPLMNTAEQSVKSSDPSPDVCVVKGDSSSCIPPSVAGDGRNKKSHIHSEGADENEYSPESDSLLHRGMQGLEAVLDKMSSSGDQMMHDLIERMSESRAKMMAGLDSMMDKMSESRTNVMKGLDIIMEKVSRTKKQMMEGFDNVLDQVSHSKMMEEIDLVLESISHSKVLMELRALPQEIRESFILSARNRSYIFAGVAVAIAAAILFGGAIYYAWCHHDAWSYYIGTIEEAKALLRQAKESGLLGRSRSSSEDNGNNAFGTENSSTDSLKNSSVDKTQVENGDVHQDESNQSLPLDIPNSIESDQLDFDSKPLKQEGLRRTNSQSNCVDEEDDDDVFSDNIVSNIPKQSNFKKND